MNKNYVFSSISLLALLGTMLLTTSCGHQETAGSLIGAGTGAALGAAVTGHNSHGTGAVIGALAGGLLGSAVGRSADEDDEAEHRAHAARIHAQRESIRQQEIDRMRAENERLKERWCNNCGKKVTLTGANSCPACGGELIRERYCRECATIFTPTSGYHYCPYCKHGRPLAAR